MAGLPDAYPASASNLAAPLLDSESSQSKKSPVRTWLGRILPWLVAAAMIWLIFNLWIILLLFVGLLLGVFLLVRALRGWSPPPPSG